MIRTFIWLALLTSISVAVSAQSIAAKALTARQLSIVPIAALAAKGDQDRLKPALNKGLDAGLTTNEIKEILVQLYAYAGFPRSLNAIGNFTAVVKERKERGLKDPEGKLPEKIVIKNSKYEYGKIIQAELTGASANSVQQFVPVIDSFLKEHLFADIFGRNNLDFQSRELATVSILATIGYADAQLRSHIGVARNVGLSELQLRSVAAILTDEVSIEAGSLTSKMIAQVFKSETAAAAASSSGQTDNPTFAKGNKAGRENFSGDVWVNMLTHADTAFSTSVGGVSFAPRARSKWHRHPSGQILLVTDGVGYYQEKGKPARIIRKGDVIKCPPDLEHWRGASHNEPMSHVALGPDRGLGAVVWLSFVTDEEYNRVK